MGKWYDWYENQKQWDTMLEQVNEATRSSVQERSDTHEASEKAKYDYPWKKLSMQQTALGTAGGGDQGMDLGKSLKTYKNIKKLFGGEKVGFDEGSYEGVASDPSGYNIDYGGGESSSGILDWVSDLFGGGGGGEGASSAGEGASSILGYIAAAIGAQVVATNSTSTVFEGQKTGNVFTVEDGNWKPSVTTEPWLAKLHDNWGWEPTQGEKFDAAVKNRDWGNAAERFPAAADYWADPIRSWLGFDTFKNQWGDTAGWIADPIGGVMDKIQDWF